MTDSECRETDNRSNGGEEVTRQQNQPAAGDELLTEEDRVVLFQNLLLMLGEGTKRVAIATTLSRLAQRFSRSRPHPARPTSAPQPGPSRVTRRSHGKLSRTF
jgi:hypothetical protein